MKVVINKCYGGFGLSEKGYEFLEKEWDDFGHGSDIRRDNPKLVECVETLGSAADGHFSMLKVVEIPDGTEYTIEEYDGIEWVAEVHNTWS